MKEYIEQFIQYLTHVKRKSNNTIISTKRDLYKMADFFEESGVTDVRKVNETRLNSYILYLEKNNMSTSTMSRYISSIKSFFLYLMKNRIIDIEPTEQLTTPKVDKKVPVILLPEQVDKLLAQPDITTNIGLRDKAMLEVLYATGIKVSELIQLKVSDADMNVGFIVCRNNVRERMIPLGDMARQALYEYLKKARMCIIREGEEDILFANYMGSAMSRQAFWKIIKQYGRKADISMEITPQTLRHSFAAHMVQNGANLKVVQDMLGHSDITTTQIYADFANNRIRDTYKNTHPRS